MSDVFTCDWLLNSNNYCSSYPLNCSRKKNDFDIARLEKWLWKLWPIFCCSIGSGWPCSSLQSHSVAWVCETETVNHRHEHRQMHCSQKKREECTHHCTTFTSLKQIFCYRCMPCMFHHDGKNLCHTWFLYIDLCIYQ